MKVLRRFITTALSCLIQAWILNACVSAAEPVALTPEQRQLNLESFDTVWTTVRDRHFDPELGGLDWKAVRDELRPRVQRAESMQEARAPMIEMLDRLGHSHVGIFPAPILEAMAIAPATARASGVTGIDLRVIDGHALVTAVAPDSPAHAAGVRLGWEIVRVGDEKLAPLVAEVGREFEGSTDQMLFVTETVRSLLLGPISEPVTVRFLDDRKRRVELELGHAEEEGARFDFGHLSGLYVKADWRPIEPDACYIELSKFMNPAVVMPVFEQAMSACDQAKGLVIDLRGNPGGMIPMAMGIAGWFVEEKDRYLGRLVLRDTELKAIVFPRPERFGGRLAILVDGLSGSSAEIFAGGLQDLGRARIFGTRTAGAALPSEIIKLPNGDGFQYVIGDYFSAGGGHLEGVGVKPDVEVQLTREALLRERDSVVEAALEWIRQAPAEEASPTAETESPEAA